MEKIDFSPVGNTVNGMAIQFGIVMITGAIAFIVVFILLRALRFPKQLANFLATVALLAALYYSFTTNYLSWVQSLVG
ncbi:MULTISPECIES: hypothetical protein [Niallia]|jgi:apolipoprotein N-acyltransferase|uniref:Uncharacterized protein n=1 Tax=Niallia circulans TaxID=1397 RepID=A0A268F5I9_NIACI|nr:hypothetical protein [Niallia circulans]AYV67243.1 hypothetical protein C2I06_10340 [Niallia circulans]NRG29023.1 hypothetical protein [Niallia circulans]PAD80633.1 hypothetical protein CHH57_24020 [Niallia circulans]